MEVWNTSAIIFKVVSLPHYLNVSDFGGKVWYGAAPFWKLPVDSTSIILRGVPQVRWVESVCA